MNKVVFLKRTQTAGVGFRDTQERDLKAQTFTQITQIQEDEAKVNRQLKMLLKKKEQITEEIKQKEQKIEEKRMSMITPKQLMGEHNDKGVIDKKRKMKRQASNIKFNLDYLKQKENEFISLKVELHNDIDRMRKEKNMFQKIWNDLCKDIKSQEKVLSDQSRDNESNFKKLQSEMETLSQMKKNQAQEQRRFGSEFRSIFDKFKGDNKSPIRQGRNRSEESKGTEDELSEQELKYEFLHLDESTNKKKKQLLEKEQKAQQNQQEQHNLQLLQSEVETYDHTLKQLMDQTRANQIDDIVNTFADQEEQNYGAFKYINELSDDLDLLQKQNMMLSIEFQDLMDRPIKMKQDPKYKLKKEIKNKIKVVKNKIQEHQNTYIEITKILKELQISIPIMFERIGCNQKEYMQLLGPNFVNCSLIQSFKEMDEDKLIRVLGIIEVRTNDILQMQDIAQNPRLNFIKKEAKINPLGKIDDIGGFQDQNNMQLQEEQMLKMVEKIQQDKDSEPKEKLLTEKQLKELAEKQVKTQVVKKTKR